MNDQVVSGARTSGQKQEDDEACGNRQCECPRKSNAVQVLLRDCRGCLGDVRKNALFNAGAGFAVCAQCIVQQQIE